MIAARPSHVRELTSRKASSARRRPIPKAVISDCLDLVDHRRTVKHRLIEIERASKSFTESSRKKFKDGYGTLMGIARGVVRQAETVMQALQDGSLPTVGSLLSVTRSEYELQHFLPLVSKVLAQTRARVFEGERHYPDKIVSIFEEHTAVICKGKASKPTEFGRLVRIDEVENGIVSHYDVADGNPADQPQWMPALDKHTEQFGQPPQMATADRGFFSANNEQQAKKLGVKRVALPAPGRSKKRVELQQQRWFRRALASPPAGCRTASSDRPESWATIREARSRRRSSRPAPRPASGARSFP